MKLGAFGILTTIVLGLMGWAGSAIKDHGEEIAKLKVHKQYMHRDIKVIKQDVKTLLRKIQ